MVGTGLAMDIHSAMNIRIAKEVGVRSMGGVIIILSRGMGERLTYVIPARYRVVLVKRLGGFDGRCSCTEVSLVVRVCTAASLSWLLLCETRSEGFK